VNGGRAAFVLSGRSRAAFLILVLVQACHSIEEYFTRLYDVFAPARYVSGLFSEDRRVGFLIFNIGLIAFGLWCFFVPIRRGHPSARGLAWFWTALEGANGTIHILWAVVAGAYRPGLVTAPLLVFVAWVLARSLRADRAVKEPSR